VFLWDLSKNRLKTSFLFGNAWHYNLQLLGAAVFNYLTSKKS